ncbi:hypothetical protein [Egicoccus sp. AB-alg2]|uniref:hypothetical protein n=1 Tax=Egicoccus sp. AB-alg2 TaxID=3242693 RepID=UPI00359E1996
MAGSLALAACTSTGSANPAEDPPEAAPPATDEDGPDDPLDEPDRPTDDEAVGAAYEAFLDALTAAMEAGDPDLTELTEHVDGAGLVSAQAMVVSLTEAGRVARGEFVPSFESIEVIGDLATVEDCYRADLVEYDAATDEQVADRGGARFAATARLERDGGSWRVTEFAQGDVCAPAAIAAEVRDRYLAFWDAVWSAADPPDPDHRGLAETAAGTHLEGVQAQLTQLRDAGQVRRGRGTEHPVVTYVTDRDTAALATDCVEENPEGGVYDVQSGERIEGGAAPGQRTLLETRLELIEDAWRVVNVRVVEEDSSCAYD